MISYCSRTSRIHTLHLKIWELQTAVIDKTWGVSSFQVQADTAQLGLANNDKELEAISKSVGSSSLSLFWTAELHSFHIFQLPVWLFHSRSGSGHWRLISMAVVSSNGFWNTALPDSLLFGPKPLGKTGKDLKWDLGILSTFVILPEVLCDSRRLNHWPRHRRCWTGS